MCFIWKRAQKGTASPNSFTCFLILYNQIFNTLLHLFNCENLTSICQKKVIYYCYDYDLQGDWNVPVQTELSLIVLICWCLNRINLVLVTNHSMDGSNDKRWSKFENKFHKMSQTWWKFFLKLRYKFRLICS